MRLSATLALALALTLPATANERPAQPIDLSIDAAGGIFEGGPHFVVSIDGAKIGEGTAANTAGEVFWFRAPNGAQASKIEVDFTNDKYGGKGLDRNLLIRAIKLGDRDIDLNSAEVQEGVGSRRKDGVALYRNGRVTFAVSQGKYAATSPALKCKTKPVVVPGFAVNSTELPDGVSQALDEVVGQKSIQGCRLVVVGEASSSRPIEWNQTLAEQRASVVAKELVKRGWPISALRVTTDKSLDATGKDIALRRVILRVELPR